MIQILNTWIRYTLLSVTSDCKQKKNQQPRVSIWPQPHTEPGYTKWWHFRIFVSLSYSKLQLANEHSRVEVYTTRPKLQRHFLYYRSRSDVKHQKYHCECTQWRKLDEEKLSYVKTGT